MPTQPWPTFEKEYPWNVFLERWSTWETKDETNCGYGSMWTHAKGCAEWLQGIFKKYEIKTLNDAGCGDLNWMKRVDLSGIDYLGYDLVAPENKTLPFEQCNIALEPMRKADAILCRDVLFHFPNDDVGRTLEMFRRSSSGLLISTSSPGASTERHQWQPTLIKNFTPLDLEPWLGKPMEFLEEPTMSRQIGIWHLNM